MIQLFEWDKILVSSIITNNNYFFPCESDHGILILTSSQTKPKKKLYIFEIIFELIQETKTNVSPRTGNEHAYLRIVERKNQSTRFSIFPRLDEDVRGGRKEARAFPGGGYALKNPGSGSLARELVRNTSDGNERFAGRTGTRNVKWRVMRGRQA